MSVILAERSKSKKNEKVVSISSKRQITIPQEFYQTLGFEDKAECIMQGDKLIIRPVKADLSGEFAEEILSELIQEGYSGEKLLSEFKSRRKKVRPAIKNMLTEAKAVAEDKAPYMTYNDVFEEEES